VTYTFFVFVFVYQRSSQSSWQKYSQDAFINGRCDGDDTRPAVARHYPKTTMPSTQINTICATEEEVHVWLKDMQEVQHTIFDRMNLLETGIAMLVEELTTINIKNKGLNHSIGQIAELLDHVFP
jgi:hypothetical protein